MFRAMNRTALIVALLLAGAPTAYGAVGEWTNNDNARVRLIASPVDETGHIDAGIEIELAPDWTTYWRSPGDAGIAPAMDFSGSKNLGPVDVAFPVPKRHDDGFSITNVYTGNSAAGVRGAAYNPNTGVISGGAVGGVRNGSTGQVTAGGGGFAYNTRTNTGVAVGNNNVYASKDGSLYRYNQSTGMQQKTSSGWETVQRSADRSWVQNQQNARGLGEMRTRDFSSMRGNLRNGGGGFRRR